MVDVAVALLVVPVGVLVVVLMVLPVVIALAIIVYCQFHGSRNGCFMSVVITV